LVERRVEIVNEVRVFHRPHPSPKTDEGGSGLSQEMAGATRSEAMNVMTVDGYNARIDYDPEIDMFRGEILGLTGGADFYGKTPKELRSEFKKSLAVFLAVCTEKGIEPRRNYSGKFNLRISPELHERLAIAAQVEGKSINTLAQEALAQRVAV
jgi:predicted HicB family RNase H-like nuclease